MKVHDCKLMDLNRLKHFTTIARTGSVRKAAELLRLSPPALSKSTRLLEEELGVKLVNRAGRNIVLTDAGRVLAERAQVLLHSADELRAEMETGALRERVVRIATFEVFSTHFLKFLAGPFWDVTPFSLYEVIPGELERALVERKADYGITYQPVPHPELEHVLLTSLEMGVFVRADAFLGLRQSDLPFVTPSAPIHGSPNRVRGLDGWPDDAYPRKIRYQVTLMESALELCRQGKAAGYFPTFIIAEHNRKHRAMYRLARRPSVYPGRVCKTDLYLARRKASVEDRAFRELAKSLRRLRGL